MQLVFAIPGDLDARTGGTLYDRKVVDALRRAGHDVTLLALPGDWPDQSHAQETEALARLNALPDNCPVIIDGLAYGALSAAVIRNPVVAMVHHPLALEPGLTPDAAARLHAREQANLAKAAQVVVPSAHVGGLLSTHFGMDAARVHVAHPGFDAAHPAPGTVTEGPPLILSVGLVCHRKGHDVLLRALGAITDLDWRAVIVGRLHEPGHVAELRKLHDLLGLAERVTLAGELDAAELSALYAQASLFALATRYEGYGMVLSEAQQHGLPVISCDTGAVPEALDGSGLLAPPDDAPAFAAHLRAVLRDADLRARLRAQSRARAARLPTWDDAARVMAQAVAAAQPVQG